MARVNVESSLYKDIRFINLVLALGDLDTAIGALVRAWTLGQEYWKNSDNGIPVTVWKEQKLKQQIIDSGLAEMRGEFVYIRGSIERFGWIRERVESGRRGGVARCGIDNHSTKSQAKLSKTKQNEASYSLSLSSSKKKKNRLHESSQSSLVVKPESKELTTGMKTNSVIGAYVTAYQKRYSADPPITGWAAGQLKNLTKTVSPSDLMQLVQVYVQMDEPYYLKRAHDLGTFITDLTKISTAWQTGRIPGARETHDEEMERLKEELGAE